MVHIPKEKRSKLSSTSINCIMVGYSHESKAYRLHNPRTRETIISRDIIFLENEKSKNITVAKDLYFSDPVQLSYVNSEEKVTDYFGSSSLASSDSEYEDTDEFLIRM